MNSSCLGFLLVILTLATEGFSLPYRTFSSRSVPGRIRSSASPDSIKDYLSYYLSMAQRHQQPYGLPEYEPTYQQGYLTKRPQVNPDTIAALLPYISQTESGDYSYDYNGVPSNSYTDEEGTWYDDETAPEYFPVSDTRDKNNEQAALLQLFLDHLAGKYSLEDLETLEREAVMEDNTENQLQALLPRKRSYLPSIVSRPQQSHNIVNLPVRQGQKEESVNVPAASVRKPIFTRSQTTVQKQRPHLPKVSLTESNIHNKETKSTSDKFNVQKNKPEASLQHSSTTMEPALKSAYDAFHNYLAQERAIRQNRDEASTTFHKPQKRFIAEPLTQQLASLKKTIT